MQGGSSQCDDVVYMKHASSIGGVHIGDVIYEWPLISIIQKLRMPTPTSHYGCVFQNASRSQQARSAIAMSLVQPEIIYMKT